MHLTYDHRWVLASMTPRDVEFLGWHADDILGTFFLITTDMSLIDDQERACAIAQAMVVSGLRTFEHHMLARCASGDAVPVHVKGEFLADEQGRFSGVTAFVTPG